MKHLLAVTVALAVLGSLHAAGAAASPRPAASRAAKRASPAPAPPADRKEPTAGPRDTLPVVTPVTAPAPAAEEGDSALVLRGGSEGTVFRSLTVEGEDRVRVEFERPALELDIDPAAAPGLDLGTARDVLDRTQPDLTGPLLDTALEARSPYLAHAWLRRFASGTLARFQPEGKDVARWKLTVVDAQGRTVTNYEGRGTPPREIDWDGRSTGDVPVVPGLAYSYVFEAYDRAGNRRRFVGEGFQVPAFRLARPEGPELIFSGAQLGGASTAGGTPSPLLIEAATWLNQPPAAARPVRVTVTARSAEQAGALATRVVRDLGVLTLGDPARIQAATQVRADAPEDGAIRVGPATGRP